MLRAMAVVALAVGVLWADVGHAQRGEPSTSPFGYAAFSLGDILLRDGVRAIDGDVGSNNGTATVGKNVRVAGSVVGRIVKLRWARCRTRSSACCCRGRCRTSRVRRSRFRSSARGPAARAGDTRDDAGQDSQRQQHVAHPGRRLRQGEGRLQCHAGAGRRHLRGQSNTRSARRASSCARTPARSASPTRSR